MRSGFPLQIVGINGRHDIYKLPSLPVNRSTRECHPPFVGCDPSEGGCKPLGARHQRDGNQSAISADGAPNQLREVIVKLFALFIGLFVVAIASLGIAAPGIFLEAARFFQVTPVIYLAAVVRVVIGIIFIGAAPASRAPQVLRVLGVLVVIAGLITPFGGVYLAQLILQWWSAGGPALVRACAAVGLALGIFIVYAFAPDRRAA